MTQTQSPDQLITRCNRPDVAALGDRSPIPLRNDDPCLCQVGAGSARARRPLLPRATCLCGRSWSEPQLSVQCTHAPSGHHRDARVGTLVDGASSRSHAPRPRSASPQTTSGGPIGCRVGHSSRRQLPAAALEPDALQAGRSRFVEDRNLPLHAVVINWGKLQCRAASAAVNPFPHEWGRKPRNPPVCLTLKPAGCMRDGRRGLSCSQHGDRQHR